MRFENERETRRLILQVLAERTTTVTLTENATSTTLTDARIRYDSPIILVPTTSNAAGALATTYISESSRANGSAVITHANNAQTDRTFRVLIG
jgi:hypothetical protein